jgi:small subunit ribosomal protein S4
MRIEEERNLLKEYGLRRKKEIWRAEAIVREFRRRARNLIATKDDERTKVLLNKLVELGLLEKNQGLDHVLALTVNDVLNRRLQTLVHKKGICNSMKQARQYITHGHIYIEGRKITYPSYIVPVEKEKLINLRRGKK